MSDSASSPDMLNKWRTGLPHETEFWRKQVEVGDDRWSGEIQRRLEDRELHPNFQAAIGAPEGAHVKVLDVGSGPVSVLGNVYPGRELTIIPTDPLADEYNAMLDRAKLPARHRPVRCEAEKLVEKFGENSFDMAFCHNALDHCYDPVLAVEQMLAVVKPGMTVRLEHVQNEGVREDYVGLHQWNLTAEASGNSNSTQDFVVWNPQKRVNMTQRLSRRAEVNCFLVGDWLSVILRKLP